MLGEFFLDISDTHEDELTISYEDALRDCHHSENVRSTTSDQPLDQACTDSFSAAK